MKLSDEELGQFTSEIDSILGYVEQIKEVSASATAGTAVADSAAVGLSGQKPVDIHHRHALREDIDDRDLSAPGEAIISAPPESQAGFVKL